MATFVVTFPVGGPLRHCFTVIDAVDEESARILTVREYGNDGFGALYPANDRAIEMVAKYELTGIPFGPLNAPSEVA